MKTSRNCDSGKLPQPYKITPVFNQETLPEAIRSEHRTKAGTWGLLRVLEGSVRLVFSDPYREILVTPSHPAEIAPQATHFVRCDDAMALQVEFYRERPLGAGNDGNG